MFLCVSWSTETTVGTTGLRVIRFRLLVLVLLHPEDRLGQWSGPLNDNIPAGKWVCTAVPPGL